MKPFRNMTMMRCPSSNWITSLKGPNKKKGRTSRIDATGKDPERSDVFHLKMAPSSRRSSHDTFSRKAGTTKAAVADQKIAKGHPGSPPRAADPSSAIAIIPKMTDMLRSWKRHKLYIL
jgi:hypothetical protein